MKIQKFFRALSCSALLLLSGVLATPGYALDSEDSQMFIVGFNAYQKKNFDTAVEKMDSLLQKYPETPLRDMAIFWLARAHYKAGHQQEAARYMAQFFREYPDSPLKGTVEDELVILAGRYAKEKLPVSEKVAGEKTATERLAQEQSEVDGRAAAKKAEEMRLAVEKAAAEKAAAERAAAAKKAEEQRVAAERAAAEKARQEKIALEKATAEKAAAERAAAARKAEEQRIAAEKAANEKARQEKIALEKAAAEQAAAERAAAARKAEEQRIAAEKAAAEKARQEKVALEKAAAEQAAAERAAVARKAEEQRVAAERAAAEKARQEKIALEKAAAEKAAAEKAAAEQAIAARKAEEQRVVAERAAAEKARQEKIALEKAAAEKAAAEKAHQEKVALEKAAAERAAAEKARHENIALGKAFTEKTAAIDMAKEEAAPDKALPAKATAAPGRKKEKQSRAARAASLREKAIGEYKSVIDRFPGTAAAASAAAKLKELGVVYPVTAATGVASHGENAKVLTLEVGQFADLDFVISPPAEPLESGKSFRIPFEIVNLGNGADSFYMESGFPSDYNVQFVSAAQPEKPINVTPQLKAGEKYKAIMSVAVPKSVVDGQRISYPIKVGSRFATDASQSKEVKLLFSAPLLRAVIKAEKVQLQPGEKISYRVDLLNIGTASARGVTLRLNYPPQFEPVALVPSAFKQEMKAALVLDELQLNSGESKEFNLTFQLKEDALALQELFVRADVINTDLEKKDSFLSPATIVQGISGVHVRTSVEKLTVIPGQTMRIPMIVTNTGNIRQDFGIRSIVPGNAAYSFFLDMNRDGKKQENEPVINHVGPLSPKEEANVVLEVMTPPQENDGAIMPMTISFEPEADKAKSASLNVRVVYSRPVLDLVMTGKGGKVKPGEVASFELSCTNHGSNMAKVVDVQTVLPEQLAIVSADPTFSKGTNGIYTWRFEDMGAGEKRSIKVTYKVKPGAAVGTNMQVKNILTYQDLLGAHY